MLFISILCYLALSKSQALSTSLPGASHSKNTELRAIHHLASCFETRYSKDGVCWLCLQSSQRMLMVQHIPLCTPVVQQPCRPGECPWPTPDGPEEELFLLSSHSSMPLPAAPSIGTETTPTEEHHAGVWKIVHLHSTGKTPWWLCTIA